jgi:hypothetical protein
LSNRILVLLAFCALIVGTLAAQDSSPSNFNRFTYNVGAGPGIGHGDVASFVGNSFNGVAGAGMNFTRIFGADVEYMYYDLNFKRSVAYSNALPNQSGHMQSVSLDGIVNAPFHFHKVGLYGVYGVGFYRRSVSVNSQQLNPGALCQPAWRWWDLNCEPNNIIVVPQVMSSHSLNAGGFNYGAGLTWRLNRLHHANIYAEYRYHRAYTSDGLTIVAPITVGLRW